MQFASPIAITRDAPGGSQTVQLVDVDIAASAIDNFLAAVELDGIPASPRLNFAIAMAELRLADWGMRRQSLLQVRGA